MNRGGAAMWVLCAMLVLGVFCCEWAQAERVLVQTTAYSTAGEAQRTWLHEITPGCAGPIPHGYPLPGRGLLAAIASGPDDDRVAVWSQTIDPREPAAFLSAYQAEPLRPASSSCAAWGDQAQVTAGVFGVLPSGGTGLLVSLGIRIAADEASEGWLGLYEWPQGGVPALEEPPASWALPGRPAAAVLLPASSTIAVLCDVPGPARTAIHVRDVAAGHVVAEAQRLGPVEDGNAGQAPTAMACSRDGRYLFVLTCGYEGDDAVSRLHAVDTVQFSPVCAPRAVSGVAPEGAAALTPCEDAACWVATRSPGTGFATATKVEVAAGKLVKKAEPSFTAMVRPVQVAAAPEGPGVAFGADNLLDVWPEGVPGAEPVRYEDPVGALAWGPGRLYAGEGGRLHVLDTRTGASVWDYQFQTGVITGIHPLGPPSPGTASALADADEDGVVDALDPEPAARSPVLDVPGVVTLRGEGAGSAFRSVYVAGPNARESVWRLEYDRGAMPWLHVYPATGLAPGWFLMGVDPAGYGTPETAVGGWIQVHLSGTRQELAAARSPGHVLVRVLPRRNAVRRILWILGGADEGAGGLRDAADGYRLRALADLLAAPPHHFSHREASGAYLDSFTPYTVVVLSAAAAAHGAVNRPELLDYVTAGGSLLFLGERLTPDTRPASARWLAPLDIHLDTTIQVDGAFPFEHRPELCRHWDDFVISKGCKVGTTGPAVAVVEGPSGAEQCAFIAKARGRGRVAVLAASTPIETAALERESNRSFAADLFRWLANATRENQDIDDDGLPDAVEDPDGDGVSEGAETDKFNPDTDGDGVTDGGEDRNRNGRVDPGETSPLNPDTDGDGILDGADVTPAPAA